MNKLSLYLVALVILLIVMACPDNGVTYSDGTLTVGLVGYSTGDGHQALFGVYAGGSDPYTDPIIAMGQFTIGDGGGSFQAEDPSNNPWTGTGGTTYDVYLWVDLNDNWETITFPESGDDSVASSFPYSVLIDGNVTITFTGANMVPAP